VAMVAMLSSGGELSAPGQPVLNSHGVLDHRKQQRPTDGAAPPPIDSSERDDGRLIVDEYGEVSHNNGQVNLPCLLGPLGAVAIDFLSSGGEKTWQHEEMVTITGSRRSSDDPLRGIRPPGFATFVDLPPPPFFGGPFWRWAEPQFHYPAMQQITYSADKPQGTTVVIHKCLKLKTFKSAGESPKLELNGTGETTFDLEAGVPKKITFSGKFILREDSQALQVPVTLLCERATGSATLPPAESPVPPVAGAAPPAAAAPRAAAPGAMVPGAAMENVASATTRLDGLLADLRATDRDWNKCFRALEELSLMGPIEKRREEVAEVLNNYLAEKNYSARSSALHAVRIWGARRNVPALIPLLNSSESDSIRQRAIEALAGLRDPQAAVAIAARVKDASDRPAALRALRALGHAAEDATIALLADPDPEVCDEACKLLGEIGGAKSIAALKEQAGKGKDPVRSSVRAALEKLQPRP